MPFHKLDVEIAVLRLEHMHMHGRLGLKAIGPGRRYGTGNVEVSATRVKSHDHLVLLVSGVLSRALHLGLPSPASQPFLNAIDELCATWSNLLRPAHTTEVIHAFSMTLTVPAKKTTIINPAMKNFKAFA